MHLPKVEEVREEGPTLVVCVANEWLLLPCIVLERGVVLFAAGKAVALIDCNAAEHSAIQIRIVRAHLGRYEKL